MPAWVKDEDKWSKAESIAAQAGHEKDWPYIAGIYKRMGGRIAKRKKGEKSMPKAAHTGLLFEKIANYDDTRYTKPTKFSSWFWSEMLKDYHMNDEENTEARTNLQSRGFMKFASDQSTSAQTWREKLAWTFEDENRLLLESGTDFKDLGPRKNQEKAASSPLEVLEKMAKDKPPYKDFVLWYADSPDLREINPLNEHVREFRKKHPVEAARFDEKLKPHAQVLEKQIGKNRRIVGTGALLGALVGGARGGALGSLYGSAIGSSLSLIPAKISAKLNRDFQHANAQSKRLVRELRRELSNKGYDVYA